MARVEYENPDDRNTDWTAGIHLRSSEGPAETSPTSAPSEALTIADNSKIISVSNKHKLKCVIKVLWSC